MRPANGTARTCVAQRGELVHSRVMSRDGQDVAVVTAIVPEGFVTGVYPVQQGYLVMLRQAHFEASSLTPQIARDQHEQLVRVLVESGVRVVRARRHTQQAQRWIPERVGAIA